MNRAAGTKDLFIRAGVLRPTTRDYTIVRPVHIPERYPVLRLDAAGAGHAWRNVRDALREEARA